MTYKQFVFYVCFASLLTADVAVYLGEEPHKRLVKLNGFMAFVYGRVDFKVYCAKEICQGFNRGREGFR